MSFHGANLPGVWNSSGSPEVMSILGNPASYEGYEVSANPFTNPNAYNNELTYAINKDNQLFNTNSATTAYDRQKELDDLSRVYSSAENEKLMEWQANENALNREWQNSANKVAMDFERSERLAQQEFQAEMSNTAIQRQVVDLKKAGLNPILAATTLGGASSPAGSTGSGYANGAGTGGISPVGASRGSVYNARANSLSASSVYHIGDLATSILNTAGSIAKVSKRFS